MTIKTLQVGPIMTNCYLLCDEDAKVCALIDPGDDESRIEKLVGQSGCALKYILPRRRSGRKRCGCAAPLCRRPDRYIQSYAFLP